jgi:hypothetical protein
MLAISCSSISDIDNLTNVPGFFSIMLFHHLYISLLHAYFFGCQVVSPSSRNIILDPNQPSTTGLHIAGSPPNFVAHNYDLQLGHCFYAFSNRYPVFLLELEAQMDAGHNYWMIRLEG